MLLLLFHIAEDIYAIDSTHVVEVLPLVMLRKVQQAPHHVGGVFRYRNCVVPVIDLCQLIHGEACRSRYSTRIIMLEYSTKNGDRAYVGLLAEQVTETLNQPDIVTPVQSHNNSYFGEVLMSGEDTIQRLRWESLISDIQSVGLIAGGTG